MNRKTVRLFFLVLFSLVCLWSFTELTVDMATTYLKIENATFYDIVELYVIPAFEDEEEWGDNYLGVWTVEPGKNYTLILDNSAYAESYGDAKGSFYRMKVALYVDDGLVEVEEGGFLEGGKSYLWTITSEEFDSYGFYDTYGYYEADTYGYYEADTYGYYEDTYQYLDQTDSR